MLGTTVSLKLPLVAYQRGQQHAQHIHGGENGGVDNVSALECFFHTFSPTFFPSIPAGFTSSTRMRMRNTKVSDRLELM